MRLPPSGKPPQGQDPASCHAPIKDGFTVPNVLNDAKVLNAHETP
jgi:hypothetical protein